jgi:hypothetical protein
MKPQGVSDILMILAIFCRCYLIHLDLLDEESNFRISSMALDSVITMKLAGGRLMEIDWCPKTAADAIHYRSESRLLLRLS